MAQIQGASAIAARLAMERKGFCEKCRKTVRLTGHEEECEMEGAYSEWASGRKYAWIGNAMIVMDIKLGLMLNGTESGILAYKLNDVTDETYKRYFYNTIVDKSWLVQPNGEKEQDVVDAVDCNYVLNEVFRSMYLAEIFGVRVTRGVVERIRPPDLSELFKHP